MIPRKDKRRNKRCTTGQRISFITQLVTKINQLTPQNNQIQFGIRIDPLVRKFLEFNFNRDSYLSIDEFQTMIDDVTMKTFGQLKSPTRLTACVNSMFDYCDFNSDGNIYRDEFLQCFDYKNIQQFNEAYLLRRREQRKGVVEKFQPNLSFPPTNYQPNKNRQNNQLYGLNSEMDVSSSPLSIMMYSSTGSILKELLVNDDNNDSKQQQKNKKKKSDCTVIRSNAIESTRVHPSINSVSFVPNCTAEGFYVPIQCHLMNCWCMSKVSGAIIKQLNVNSNVFLFPNV